MPKNKIGGKGAKRGKNIQTTRVLLVKENDQEYALVKKLLGDGRLLALCNDGIERLCIIRGAMKKKVWIGINDIILIALRSNMSDDKKADVIHKYFPEEVKQLKFIGEINDIINNSSEMAIQSEEAEFNFEDEES